MKRMKTGLAGALTCVFLTGCIFQTSNSSEDEEETQNTNSIQNPIVRNVEFMNVWNCLHIQAAVFWKKASEPNSEALRFVFPPGNPNPLNCGTGNHLPFPIHFDNGVAYDVWTVRIANNCHTNGDSSIDVEPGDCPRVDVFRVNGTNDGKLTEVRIN